MGLFKYINDTRAEMKHVAWPTQKQTMIFTTLVIVVSLLTSLYLGFFDFVFTRGLQEVLPVFEGRSIPLDSATTSGSELPEGLEFTATPVNSDGSPTNITGVEFETGDESGSEE